MDLLGQVLLIHQKQARGRGGEKPDHGVVQLAGQLRHVGGVAREIGRKQIEAAQRSGLRYVADSLPGIRRKRVGKATRYFDARGKALKNADEITRIKALAVPPAS